MEIQRSSFTQILPSLVKKINKRDRTDLMSISRSQMQNDKSFCKHLMLLSGDIEVNPGPVQYPQSIQYGIPNTQYKNDLDKLEMFSKQGLHFIHVDMNSVLPKIEEIRYNACSVNLSIIVLSESKLDNSVDDNEISIPGYDILRKDRNRSKGGGGLTYIKKIWHIIGTFQDTIENVREFSNQELYILGDMNINLNKNIKNKSSIASRAHAHVAPSVCESV